MTKNTTPSCEICLYGRVAASGWLAGGGSFCSAGDMYGDGLVQPGRSLTESVWQAQDALAGYTGSVWIYAPCGGRRARVRLTERKCFGDLTWEAAPMLVLSEEDIKAASTPA